MLTVEMGVCADVAVSDSLSQGHRSCRLWAGPGAGERSGGTGVCTGTVRVRKTKRREGSASPVIAKQ